MNLRGDVSRRQPGDVGYRRGVQPLKIQKDHLPILRPERMNEFHESIQRQLLVQMFIDAFIGRDLKDVNVNEYWIPRPTSNDVGHSSVMCDPVNPSSQRAALIEKCKAAPQCEVDFLNEIAALLSVGFIAAC